MDRNKWLAGILIIVFLGFAGYAAFFQKTFQHQVEIPYSLLKIDEQLSIPSNIIKWYTPFSSEGGQHIIFDSVDLKIIYMDHSLKLQRSAVVGATYEASNKDETETFFFSIEPDSAASTKVKLTYRSTLLRKWLGNNDLETNAIKSLEQLKSHMEDTKSLYGFEIQNETVTDTAFLFKTMTVRKENRQKGMKQVFDELEKYAEEKKAGFNGVRIFYSQHRSTGDIELYAGISVNNHVVTKPGDPVQYKLMPGGKNLLSAYYQGPYGKVGDAYDALQQFKSDHNLISMAIPFEKFLSNDYNFSDSQTVQLKVYYPIF